MVSPSRQGRYILFLLFALISSLMFLIGDHSVWPERVSLILWSSLGWMHLGSAGWSPAPLWQKIQSLPAELLRTLSRQEHKKDIAVQASLDSVFVKIWLGMAGVLIAVLIIGGEGLAPPSALVTLQTEASQFDGLNIQVAPPATGKLEHVLFILCLGLSAIIGQSLFSGISGVKRAVLILVPALFAVVLFGYVLADPVVMASIFWPPDISLAGYGAGMAPFLSAFQAPGFEGLSPLAHRLYDTGAAGAVLTYLLGGMLCLPLLVFIVRFRQHMVWLGIPLLLGGMMLGLDLAGHVPPALWQAITLIVWPLMSLTCGYARHRLAHPYEE